MATTYQDDPLEEERKPRRWLRWLLILLLPFLVGIAVTLWMLARWDYAAAYLARLNPAAHIATPASQPVASATPSPAPAQVQAQAAATAREVQELETRIGDIETRAAAAAGNANRAEGLLVAFAARRAIEQGRPLGYVESLLRDRFGGGQPQAVATIVSAARQPVTLEDLRAGLTDAAPKLVVEGVKDSWWASVRRELAALVVVRPAGVPSDVPADRLARARRAIEQGRVDAALAEVARMPGRENAGEWIAQARRYVAVRNALDAIETAALLDPTVRTMAPAVAAKPSPPEAPKTQAAAAPAI